MSTTIINEGPMYQKAGVMCTKGLKPLWIVATDESLIAYQHQHDLKSTWQVPWKTVLRVDSHDPRPMDGYYRLKMHLMRIHGRGYKVILLYTQSEAERARWLNVCSSLFRIASEDRAAPKSGKGTSFGILDRLMEEEELEATHIPTPQGATLLQKMRYTVSAGKNRYQSDGFDLDLTYILPQLIVLGFPCSGYESLYRNPYEDVREFFEYYHPSRYKMINFCSESPYPNTHFDGHFEWFPFDDHHPASLVMMYRFCECAHNWMSQGKDYVIGAHCKAGKARTGTMIAAFLLYLRMYSTFPEALDFFTQKRMTDDSIPAVKNPSQLRYGNYMERMINEGWGSGIPSYTSLLLKAVVIHTTPHFDVWDAGCDPYFTIHCYTDHAGGKMRQMYDSRSDQRPRHYSNRNIITLGVFRRVQLNGDIKFVFLDKDRVGSDQMFFFWIHTSFLPVDSNEFHIPKSQIDKAWKDSQHFDEDFGVTLKYEWVETSYGEKDFFTMANQPDWSAHSSSKPYIHEPTYLSGQIMAVANSSSYETYIDVKKQLDEHHPYHYTVYDFCIKPNQVLLQAFGNVEHYAIPDIIPCPMSKLLEMCEAISNYLQYDSQNVAVLNCKSNSPQEVMVLASLLLYLRHCDTVLDSETLLHQSLGNTAIVNPSQFRYLGYLESFMRGVVRNAQMKIKTIDIHTTPHFDTLDRGCDPFFHVDLIGKDGKPKRVYTSSKDIPIKHYSNETLIKMVLKSPVTVAGDVRFVFFDKDRVGQETMFSYYVNTNYIAPDSTVLNLSKAEVDQAWRDSLHFEPDFAVTMHYELLNESGHPFKSNSKTHPLSASDIELEYWSMSNS